MDQRILAIPTYTLHAVTITFHRDVNVFSHSVQAAIVAAASVEPDCFLIGEQTIELLLDKERLLAVATLDEVKSLDEATLSPIQNEVPVAIVHSYSGRDLPQLAENAHGHESPKVEHSHDPTSLRLLSKRSPWHGRLPKSLRACYRGSDPKPWTQFSEDRVISQPRCRGSRYSSWQRSSRRA